MLSEDYAASNEEASRSSQLPDVQDALLNADISFALQKLAMDGELPPDDHLDAEREFKRFMYLIANRREPMVMISPVIDRVWHQMVLFTGKYRTFCDVTVGFFVDHTPETDEEPIGFEAANNFLRGYRENWGDLPDIWLRELPSEIALAYRRYPLREKPNVRWSGWTGRLQ